MSLKINNLATPKQKAILEKLDYSGTGQYALDKLTISEAAELITELFEEERLLRQEEENDTRAMMDNQEYPF